MLARKPNILKYFHYFVYSVVIVSIIFSYSSYILEKESFEIKTKEKLKDQSIKLTSQIDDSLVYIENFTNLIATKISQDEVNKKIIASILENIKPKIDDKKYDIFTWTLFDFVDPQGLVLATSTEGILKEKIVVKSEQRSWMKDVKLEPWKFHISKSDIGIVSHEPIIPIGFGITNKNNEFLGTISLGINTEKLKRILEDSSISPTLSFAIINSDNSIVTASENFDEKDYKKFQSNLTEALETSNLEVKNKFIKIGKDNFYYTKITHYPNLSIVTGVNQKTNQVEFVAEVLPKILNTIYLTIFFLVLLYFFRVKLVRPIVKLSQTANEVSNGNTEITVPTSEIDEINELAKSIEMVRQFVEKQKEEKNFVIQANYNKTEFLASTAHELKNIIAGIIGLAEITKMNFSEKMESENKNFSSEEAAENLSFLEDIVKLGEELSEFIHDILDVNQAESGDFKIEEKSLVDVKETILRSVKLLKTRAIKAKKNITTVFLKQDEEDFIVNNLDPRRLKQVIVNLVSNSIKYAADNTKIEVRLERLGETGLEGLRDSMITNLQQNKEINGQQKAHLLGIIKKSRPKILITVQDHGEGMSEDDVKIALQKYGRLKQRREEFIDSTGLGLPLAKHLVELQGGMMVIHSEKGIGTEIKIFL